MKLCEVIDEFENIESDNDAQKLKHLYRVQAARCREIDLFILRLAQQYSDWWRAQGFDQWTDHPTIEWDTTSVTHFGSPLIFSLPKLNDRAKTQKIRDIFITKYNAMLMAKHTYERAGGTYEK